MPSKFAALAADVTTPYRVELRDPRTDMVLRDPDGDAAYIEVLSTDSERAREFEKGKRRDLRQRIMRSRTGAIDASDQIEDNIALLALLTIGWHLVDLRGEVIDLPCTPENAAELYSEPGLAYVFNAVWFAANSVANFLPAGSPTSSATGNGRLQTSAD
jgi:hypothetical protein